MQIHMPRGSLAYINEFPKKNGYLCQCTAYVRLHCLNVELEFWESALDLSGFLVCIMRNKGMLLSNTILELEFSSWVSDDNSMFYFMSCGEKGWRDSFSDPLLICFGTCFFFLMSGNGGGKILGMSCLSVDECIHPVGQRLISLRLTLQIL